MSVPARRKGRVKTADGQRRADAACIARLREDNAALKKTVQALMARVERSLDSQGTAFSWFQAAAKLEETVRLRTAQYESLNQRLKRELESRRAIELALKEAKLQADLANQSKTRFLAAASHDLRQPLNSAMLFLESMDEASLAQTDREFLSRSRVALASLNNLLGTLLDVARLDSGGITPQSTDFPIQTLLDRIGPEFESVANACRLGLKVMPSRAWVCTDLHLLETILRNFLANAIKYTPAGRILVGCRRRPEGLMICVLDTGVGIEKEHLDAIFEAYYQIRDCGPSHNEGIGLGLSIVNRIVHVLALRRSVRSIPGKGSMFAVVVPYGSVPQETEVGPTSWKLPATVFPRSRPLNIVIIDDKQDVLTGLAALLEKWGYRPTTGTTATEAVVKLIAADVTPDLVLSDYHLRNELKGDDAVKEVQGEFDRPIPAVIMTSDPDPALRERLRRKGLAVIDKPLNLPKLRAMLERLPE